MCYYVETKKKDRVNSIKHQIEVLNGLKNNKAINDYQIMSLAAK